MNRLYPHQVTGAQWLAKRSRAALLDEQGLGKTITAIEAANLGRKNADRAWRICIVCPSVVLWNWAREWKRWSAFKDRIQVIQRLVEVVDDTAHVVVLSHRAIIDLRPALQKYLWDLVVLDEGHYFRNPQAARTKAFYGDYWATSPSTLSTDRCWVLTGTPMPNDIRNLWTMCWGLWPERFPSPTNPTRAMSPAEFERRYCKTRPTRFGRQAIGNLNVGEFRERVADVTLRRSKRDHLDLPAMRYESIVLRPDRIPQELELLDTALYRKLKDARVTAESDEEALLQVGWKQHLTTWRRLVGIAKAEPIAELVQMELDCDYTEKIVIFAMHIQVVELLIEKLGANRCVSITGSTTPPDRQRAVDQFQTDDRIQVFVGQIIAAGSGITLTAASEVLFAELSWVPGDNAQAADRVHRIGQTQKCRVRFVSLADTSDEIVTDVLARKTRMIREVLQD